MICLARTATLPMATYSKSRRACWSCMKEPSNPPPVAVWPVSVVTTAKPRASAGRSPAACPPSGARDASVQPAASLLEELAGPILRKRQGKADAVGFSVRARALIELAFDAAVRGQRYAAPPAPAGLHRAGGNPIGPRNLELRAGNPELRHLRALGAGLARNQLPVRLQTGRTTLSWFGLRGRGNALFTLRRRPFRDKIQSLLDGAGCAFGESPKFISMSDFGSYAGHSGRPAPFGEPVFTKFTQIDDTVSPNFRSTGRHAQSCKETR